MLRVRVTLEGNGIDVPFHANYPHYLMVSCDYENKTAIIEIPESTVAADVLTHPSATTEEVAHYASVHGDSLVKYHAEYGTADVKHQHSIVLTSIDSSIMELWYQHLDKMYQEHKEEFRHRLV